MALDITMRLVYLTSILFLSACATTSTGGPSSVAAQSGLDVPELAEGECGLFAWTTDQKRSFVFYADEDSAKFVPAGEIVQLASAQTFPALDYEDSSGNPVNLKLGLGEPLVGGMRYPSARIVSKTEDGWDRIMPVSIVKACQSG